MIKLTQDELNRCHDIFYTVWNAIAPDLDNFEGENRDVYEVCVDYVYMYGPRGDDVYFMRELYDRVGYDEVIEQISSTYHLA